MLLRIHNRRSPRPGRSLVELFYLDYPFLSPEYSERATPTTSSEASRSARKFLTQLVLPKLMYSHAGCQVESLLHLFRTPRQTVVSVS